MTLRKVFCQTGNNEADLSTRLAQTGRRDAHCHGLAQNLDQHHNSTLAIGHLENTFDAGKWHICQTHALTSLEQALGLGLYRCFLRSQQFDQTITNPRGPMPKLTI
jgi:hypothetical protein